MNLNSIHFNNSIIRPTFQQVKQKNNMPNFRAQKNQGDTFEMSVGYVNDIHGQANNMLRILSGLKGDLKLSAGDNDLGNEKNVGVHKATSAFLNISGIKASAFGNHELDTTQEDSVNNINSTKTEILATNFRKYDNWESRTDNKPEYCRAALDKALKPSTVVEVKGEKIGIVGASPIDMFERTTYPEYHKDCYVDSLDITVEEVQNEVNKLKSQGINKIILLSHLGHERDKEVAQNTDGIDIIIGGHTHELIRDIKEGENLFYSKSGEPVVITEAGKDGAYFGQLNVTFDKDGVLVKAQNNIAETRLFSKNLVYQDIFNDILGEPEQIGEISKAPAPPLTLIEENPHANFVCDAMKVVTKSDISVWNNSGIRNFFHEGSIDSRDIKDIAPFADRISVANVSEKAIVDLFKDTIKTTYNSQGYKPGLLAVSGLDYTVNETTHELVELNFVDNDGKIYPIDIKNPREDKFYKLVTDEYVMSAGADYPILATEEECLEIYPYDKDVMTCEYIKELNKPVEINQFGRIHFVK